MVTRFLLVGLIAAGLTSCATYRTGQTPDDVYYSPERTQEEYVEFNRDEDNRYSYNDRNLDDRRLRQQIRDSRFRFEDDIFWNSPRYNSWGWNTWNNPMNTWGWNTWNNPYNSWAWNSNLNNGFNNRWGSPFLCIPGSNNLIVIAGPGSPRFSTGIRYAAPIQRFPNAGNNFSFGKPTGVSVGSGSRYFGNNSNSTRSGFFSGSNNNSRSFGGSNNTYSGGSSRSFGSGSGGGSFSSGSSGYSGGGSSSGGGGGSAGGRRN